MYGPFVNFYSVTPGSDAQIELSLALDQYQLYQGLLKALPLHFSAPKDVLFFIHEHWEVLVFTLLYGIRPGGNGPHFVKL